MEQMDYWRLCDEVSVVQAALLMLDLNPASYTNIMSPGCMYDNEIKKNFSALLSALSHAILGGRLPASIRREAWEKGWDEEPGSGGKLAKNLNIFPDQNEFPEEAFGPIHRGVIYRATPDWNLTTVLVEDLLVWLKGRGFNKGFFFPQAEAAPDYLDKSNENYAPKLAAAIRAWEAVSTDPELIRGKTVKQALLKWLRKNADQYGLTKDDGNPNEQGIEEISKISNWDSKGGAPKTPG